MTSARIVYLDSSALVKLYVSEPGSEIVHHLVQTSAATSTSRIAHVEVAAATARRAREKTLAPGDVASIEQALERDLDGRLIMVEVSVALARHAAGLTSEHPLRGMDAIHLASALWLQVQVGEPVCLAAWDARLAAAAQHAGLEVIGT